MTMQERLRKYAEDWRERVGSCLQEIVDAAKRDTPNGQ